MTSLITLWPTDGLEHIKTTTHQILISDFNAGEYYASDSCADVDSTIDSAYRNLIRLTDIDPTLHVLAIVPLGCPDMHTKVKQIADACRATNHRVSLHVLCLGYSLWSMYDAPSEQEAKREHEKNLQSLKQIANETGLDFPFTFVEDYVASGAPINFSRDTFARWLANLFFGLLTDYYRIFPAAYMANGAGKNIAVGLSSISFDKKSASDYLLHRAFVTALEKSGILLDKVDIQLASTKASDRLAGLDQRFKNFVEKKVIPEFKAGRSDSDQIVAKVAGELDNEMNEISSQITGVLKESETNFPEKESILAMILGRDNKLLRGIQYDTEKPIIDDVVSDAITTYIDAYNNYCLDQNLIPVRGEFDALKLWIFNLDTGEFEESPSNLIAFNPIPDLKALKKRILDETSFIRRKNDELKQLDDANKERDLTEEGISDKGFRNKNVIKELNEKPLENIYKPSAGLKPLSSVDLRKYFSPVKDQGEIGACSSFAVAAMYEAIMNEHSPLGSKLADMSERFLFYYSNILQGRPEGGSSFYDQLNVLANTGICTEALCPSEKSKLSKPPSTEAIQNALNHRVLQALQIPLAKGDGKEYALDENHRLLTSALSEGYPVGIALKIYPHFGESAFINRPSDKEKEGGEPGYHAMVLAGYSESDKCYIVRNSWGENFGDKGYCYVSAAYIDDPEYIQFACIITKTTDNSDNQEANIPQVTAGFGGTEMQIRMAVIRNELDYANVRLTNNRNIYNETYRYYQTLLNRLCVPSTREMITNVAEYAAKERYENLTNKYDELLQTFPQKLKEFRRDYLKFAVKMSIISLIDIFSVGVITWFGIDSIWEWIIVIISVIYILITVLIWINYSLKMKQKRDELQQELDDCNTQCFYAKKAWQELRLRFHLSGMWIDRFNQLHIQITRVYDRLVNYDDNLRHWYKEDLESIAKSMPPRGSMCIMLEDADVLSKFFSENSRQILANLDLMEAFKEYSIDSKSISAVRQKLRDKTRESIMNRFSKFRMMDYLLGTTQYSFVPKRKLDDIICTLIMTGQPTWRYSGMDSDEAAYTMMICYDDREVDMWRRKTNNFFSSNPSLIDTDNTEYLLLFTVKQTPMP